MFRFIFLLFILPLVINATTAPVIAPDVATLRPTIPTASPTELMEMDPISEETSSGELDRVVVALSAVVYSAILTIMGIWLTGGGERKQQKNNGGPVYSTLKYDY